MVHKLEKFSQRSLLSKACGMISRVILGQIEEEDAILLLNKVPFSEEKMDVYENEVYQENDIYTNGVIEVKEKVKYMLIHPATPFHIKKYTHSTKVMIKESAETYKTKTLPQALALGPSCHWVDNIMTACENDPLTQNTSHGEQILHNDPEFVVIPDSKWDRTSLDTLYLLVLFKDPLVYTVRELRDTHIPMLTRIQASVAEVLRLYSTDIAETKLYFHYYPTFFRAHIHVSSLKMSWPGELLGASLLLHDVIANLELSTTYYQDRTLEIPLSHASYLYNIFSDAPGKDC
ncbi:m7GpppX diphosphatase [Nematocida displodere]|uniref:M7GpppX diphosphatase n=1 Tax=Nematocida displodere TaxID=1805483 RepID=A0A177EEX0_9MICR|nr:m7GpppX diphosphatase [Nematocida displodere]